MAMDSSHWALWRHETKRRSRPPSAPPTSPPSSASSGRRPSAGEVERVEVGAEVVEAHPRHPVIASFLYCIICRIWLVHRGSSSFHAPFHSGHPTKPRTRTSFPCDVSPPTTTQYVAFATSPFAASSGGATLSDLWRQPIT